jgi:alpha-amylase
MNALTLVGFSAAAQLPGCTTYHANQCQGRNIDTNASEASKRWFTPQKSDPDFLPSFGDYSRLVGYTVVLYADGDRQSATVSVRAVHKDSSTTLSYVFAGNKQASPNATFNHSFATALRVSVEASDGARVDLEPVDFHWNAPGVATRPGDYRAGQKGAIVEMFGWPDADVEGAWPRLEPSASRCSA